MKTIKKHFFCSSHWFLAIICFPGMNGVHRIRYFPRVAPVSPPAAEQKPDTVKQTKASAETITKVKALVVRDAKVTPSAVEPYKSLRGFKIPKKGAKKDEEQKKKEVDESKKEKVDEDEEGAQEKEGGAKEEVENDGATEGEEPMETDEGKGEDAQTDEQMETDESAKTNTAVSTIKNNVKVCH